MIVVGRTNDVELYRELMRRGASEYLVAPLSPLQLIEVISGLYLDPAAKPVGRVIAFVGARGGAGSSSIAHNVGWCIAEELNINTTIVDFDLPFGTAGLDFNDEAGQGVADALSAPERLDECCSIGFSSSAANICRCSRRRRHSNATMTRYRKPMRR